MTTRHALTALLLAVTGCAGGETNDKGEPIAAVDLECGLSPDDSPTFDVGESFLCFVDDSPYLCVRVMAEGVRFSCRGLSGQMGVWWTFEADDPEPINRFSRGELVWRGVLTEHSCKTGRPVHFPGLCTGMPPTGR